MSFVNKMLVAVESRLQTPCFTTSPKIFRGVPPQATSHPSSAGACWYTLAASPKAIWRILWIIFDSVWGLTWKSMLIILFLSHSCFTFPSFREPKKDTLTIERRLDSRPDAMAHKIAGEKRSVAESSSWWAIMLYGESGESSLNSSLFCAWWDRRLLCRKTLHHKWQATVN